VLAVSGWRLGT